MMRQINRGQRARAILGALALAALVVLSGPASAAHAAGPPDYLTTLAAASWNASPGETVNLTAFYKRKTADNGPVTVTVYLQKGYGAPTITSAVGFACTKSYQSGGWFPGWYVKCTKPSITPNGGWFEAIQIKTTAPTAPGDYLVISGIDPAAGPDLDPSDNRADQKLHVS
jgi:hypothetical protein